VIIELHAHYPAGRLGPGWHFGAIHSSQISSKAGSGINILYYFTDGPCTLMQELVEENQAEYRGILRIFRMSQSDLTF